MGTRILICTPIFLPVVRAIGTDAVQFGMIRMMSLSPRITTPPVGVCLFIDYSVGKVRMERVVRTIRPFYLALFAVLMLTTCVPATSMTLPNLLR